MTNRTYRAVLGLSLLVVLYFDLNNVMYGIIALLFIEGATNLLVPDLLCKLRNCITHQETVYVDYSPVPNARINFDSERMWRLVVGVFLLIGYSSFETSWFFPWFMGFAIFGAGLSGVCPVLFAIRWLGFK